MCDWALVQVCVWTCTWRNRVTNPSCLCYMYVCVCVCNALKWALRAHARLLTHLCVSCSVSACWPFGRTCAYTPYTRTLWCPCGASCGAAEHVWSSYLGRQTLTQSQNNSTTTSSSLLVQFTRWEKSNEACDDLSRTRRTGTLGCRRAPWDAPSACPFLQTICRICHSRGSSPLGEWTNIFF